MKVLFGSLLLCSVLALSSCTKKEAAPVEGAAPAAGEVEGSSSAPTEAAPENSPEEMQKKDNSHKTE